MKLVKARVKHINHIDPKYLCCEQAIQYLKDKYNAADIFTVDCDDIQLFISSCIYCNKRDKQLLQFIRVVESPEGEGIASLYALDLDESPESL